MADPPREPAAPTEDLSDDDTQSLGPPSTPAIPPQSKPPSVGAGLRYRIGETLGSGGMGIVYRCTDTRIGRDIAMKVLRKGHAASEQSLNRFTREARVQGQLEHPGIPPVYDFVSSDDGRAHITMKRVRGHTLQEIIERLRDGDERAREEFPRRRLLAALSSACLTVAYAHSQGVIHRDLKPANIMLGDFGEVYVLDWGLAKVTSELGAHDEDSYVETEQGRPVGTAGYQAPEQTYKSNVGPAADVYSLGVILFEILTWRLLHQGPTPAARVKSVRDGDVPPPSRASLSPGVSPELDAVCLKATALEPPHRYESARDLHDAIERYLAGVRDRERRQDLAKDHLEKAGRALAAAARGEADADEQRTTAVTELGAALALDPSNETALGGLSRVLLDPSDDLPEAAEQELAESYTAERTREARRMTLVYLGWLASAPLALLLGVRSIAAFAGICISVTAVALYAAWTWRTGRTSPRHLFPLLLLVFVAAGTTCTLFGPLVLVPGIVVAAQSRSLLTLRADSKRQIALLGLALATLFVPLALEWLGIVSPSFIFEDGVIKLLPRAFDFPPSFTLLVLLWGLVLGIVFPNFLMGRAVATLTAAERRLFVQAWRLKQLVPEGARPPRAVATR